MEVKGPTILCCLVSPHIPSLDLIQQCRSRPLKSKSVLTQAGALHELLHPPHPQQGLKEKVGKGRWHEILQLHHCSFPFLLHGGIGGLCAFCLICLCLDLLNHLVDELQEHNSRHEKGRGGGGSVASQIGGTNRSHTIHARVTKLPLCLPMGHRAAP